MNNEQKINVTIKLVWNPKNTFFEGHIMQSLDSLNILDTPSIMSIHLRAKIVKLYPQELAFFVAYTINSKPKKTYWIHGNQNQIYKNLESIPYVNISFSLEY